MSQVAFPAQQPLAPSTQQPENRPPRKLRRISRACDFCHHRSIKCQPSREDPLRCQNCYDFQERCAYLRPVKKRGVKSGRQVFSDYVGARDPESDARMLLQLTQGVQCHLLIPDKWRLMAMENQDMIKNLVSVYFQVVYPIFPWFHAPSMQSRVSSRHYLHDHSFFADTMAICALASARVKDGALFPGQWEADQFKDPPSEDFFAAVESAMPQNLGLMRGLDWMRTCALMALYGIQVGKIDIMHQYLGMYQTLVSMDSLHDEKNWPKHVMGVVEVELRRRLFWSMYTLEVYSSIVWGSIIRSREAQSHVGYPSEIDDELFSDGGYHGPNMIMPSQGTDPMCWLHGLNFATELYRILEHAMDDFHRRRPNNNRFCPSDLFDRETPQLNVVLDKVMSMFEKLPPHFKETKYNPPDVQGGVEDKFSFQAANIAATLQLVRMVLFTSKDATVVEKCDIARDLLENFNKIPIRFLKALSSPLLHHVAGIGAILGSAIEGPISESSYKQVRDVLLQMADLLANLETEMNANVGAASRIREHINKIDEYMSTQQNGHASHSSYVPYGMAPSLTPVKEESEPNPNIDPALQNVVVPMVAGPMDGFHGNINPYGFSTVDSMGMTPAMVGMEEQSLQLPPELMDFPWASDLGSGFLPPHSGQY